MLKKFFSMVLFLVLFIALMTGCGDSNDGVIFDAASVNGISYDSLVELLGKPEGSSSFSGSSAIDVYEYTLEGNFYNFYVADDKVVRMDVYSEKSQSGEGDNFSYNQSNKADSLKLFALTPANTAEAADYDSKMLRIINVCKDVDEFLIEGANESSKTFTNAKITFDSDYF